MAQNDWWMKNDNDASPDWWRTKQADDWWNQSNANVDGPIIGGGLVPFYLSVNGGTGTTTVDAGESVVIAVVERPSFPDGSPAYEWLFNGVTIDGETLDELDLGEVGESDAGEYECIVTVGDRVFRASITLLVRVWILSGGTWADTSVWNDSESWIDA